MLLQVSQSTITPNNNRASTSKMHNDIEPTFTSALTIRWECRDCSNRYKKSWLRTSDESVARLILW